MRRHLDEGTRTQAAIAMIGRRESVLDALTGRALASSCRLRRVERRRGLEGWDRWMACECSGGKQ